VVPDDGSELGFEKIQEIIETSFELLDAYFSFFLRNLQLPKKRRYWCCKMRQP